MSGESNKAVQGDVGCAPKPLILGGRPRGGSKASAGAVGIQRRVREILPGAPGWASWRKEQQEQSLSRTGMNRVLLSEREGAPGRL